MSTIPILDLVSRSRVVKPRNVGHPRIEMLGDGGSQSLGADGDDTEVTGDDGGLNLTNLSEGVGW